MAKVTNESTWAERANAINDRTVKQQEFIVGSTTAETGEVWYHEGWTAQCIQPTDLPPSPQKNGDPTYLFDGTLQEVTGVTAKQVIFGTRYTFTQSGYISAFRVYTVAGNRYEVYSILDPDGSEVTTLLTSFTAKTTGWLEFSAIPSIVAAGTVIDVAVRVNEPDPTPTVVTAEYEYIKPASFTTLSTGDIVHPNTERDALYVSYTDNLGGDRTSLLNGLVAGDVIEGAGTRWAVQSAINITGGRKFLVAPASQGDPVGVQDFNFETTASVPITYYHDVDYWIPFAGIEGFLSIDNDYDNAVYSQTAYGIDVEVQAATYDSDSWSFWSATSGVTSSGGGTVSAAQIQNELAGKASIKNGRLAYRSYSFANQNPSGTNAPIVISYGNQDADSGPVFTDGGFVTPVDLPLNNGNAGQEFVFNKAATYYMQLTGQVGRTGSSGNSLVFARGLLSLDGGTTFSPTGIPAEYEIDNANSISLATFLFTVTLPAGAILRVEFCRSPNGNDSGGLITEGHTITAASPTSPAWRQPASASIQIRVDADDPGWNS